MPKLAVISVNVHDMDAARAFYEGALGLKVSNDADAPQFLELESEGPLLLLQLVGSPATSAYPDGAAVVPNLAVDDAALELERLREAGVRLVHDTLQPSPVGPYFAVADPSGNVLELVEFSG